MSSRYAQLKGFIVILLERIVKIKLIENIRVGKFELFNGRWVQNNKMVEETLSTMEIFA